MSDRHKHSWSIPARWWYVVAGLVGGVPVLLIGWLLSGGTGASTGGFELPAPTPPPVQAPVNHTTGESEDAGETAESELASSWETPERLSAAVDFVLARGDRRMALRLLARMEPGSEVYDSALLRVNREFVDSWHAALAESLRECLRGSRQIGPAIRQAMTECLGACEPGRSRIAELPLAVGASRAILVAATARERFSQQAPDCPAGYRDTLCRRSLKGFPGGLALLGAGGGDAVWEPAKEALAKHLSDRLVFPLLAERLAALRMAARKSRDVEDWVATMVSEEKVWRAYLPSADSLDDRRAVLPLLPTAVRQSWQRDIAESALAAPGTRQLLVEEGLLEVVSPGEALAAERGILARLVIRSAKWQEAARAMDYASAEATAGRAVETLLGRGRSDVVDLLRTSLATEHRLLAAQSFPWYRVMRSLKVRETPLFWQGHPFLSPGQLAQLQEGSQQIGDIPPEDMYQSMLRHAKRLDEKAARRSAIEGAKVYALNRGLSPKRNSTR